MKIFQLFIFLIISIIVGSGTGYLMTQCKRPVIVSDTIRDTIPGDSVPYPVVLKVKDPIPVYRDTGSIQWRNRPIDTMAILAEYFTINHYDDTLMDDTSALIRLRSHVAENKLHYDSLLFQNRRPTAINTIINKTILPSPKWAIYAGIGYSNLPEPGIIPSVLAVTPGRFAFSAGYGLNSKTQELAVYYKLQFRKPKKPGL